MLDAPGGYCRYRSPAPYADEYKGYTNPDCAGPVLQVIPPPPRPRSTSSSSTARPSRTTRCWTPGVQGPALRFGTALGLAVGVAALAYAPVALAASGSLALVTSIFPYFGHISEVTGLAVGSMSAVIAGYVAGAAVVIAALTIAIIQTLALVDQAKLPGQLAALIDDARTTPPAASTLVSATGASSLSSLFVGATLPRPSTRSCDNSDPIARKRGHHPRRRRRVDDGERERGDGGPRPAPDCRHRRLVPQPHADPAGLRLRSPVRRHSAGRHRRDRVAHHHLAGRGHRGPGHGAPEPGLVRPAGGRAGLGAGAAPRLHRLGWRGAQRLAASARGRQLLLPRLHPLGLLDRLDDLPVRQEVLPQPRHRVRRRRRAEVLGRGAALRPAGGHPPVRHRDDGRAPVCHRRRGGQPADLRGQRLRPRGGQGARRLQLALPARGVRQPPLPALPREPHAGRDRGRSRRRPAGGASLLRGRRRRRYRDAHLGGQRRVRGRAHGDRRRRPDRDDDLHRPGRQRAAHPEPDPLRGRALPHPDGRPGGPPAPRGGVLRPRRLQQPAGDHRLGRREPQLAVPPLHPRRGGGGRLLLDVREPAHAGEGAGRGRRRRDLQRRPRLRHGRHLRRHGHGLGRGRGGERGVHDDGGPGRPPGHHLPGPPRPDLRRGPGRPFGDGRRLRPAGDPRRHHPRRLRPHRRRPDAAPARHVHRHRQPGGRRGLLAGARRHAQRRRPAGPPDRHRQRPGHDLRRRPARVRRPLRAASSTATPAPWSSGLPTPPTAAGSAGWPAARRPSPAARRWGAARPRGRTPSPAPGAPPPTTP